jgi:hypothetical protein
MDDPENWSFDVTTALQDDMKGGGNSKTVRSRIVLSRAAYPQYGLASDTAAALAVAIHGGMATQILPRY